MKFLRKLFSKEKDIPAKVLLEERSPTCPITAIVEQDNKVAYFYLWGDKNTRFGTKACWIRNLKEAPEKVEIDTSKKVNSPLLPKQFCKYPKGQKLLIKEDLSIVWTEEGDGAAILMKNEILTIIPSWSENGKFNGYARDCIGKGNFAWELTKENLFPKRILHANKFWESWNAELNPFYINQPTILKSYEEALGKGDKYYAIDGGEWPPKGLYLRKGNDKTVFATVGVSLLPQPQVERYYEFPNQKNRIEIGLILNNNFTENQLDGLASWISGTTDIPWKNITHLGEGHTTNFDVPVSKFLNFLIFTNQLDILPKVKFEQFRESPINLYWMIPISNSERNFVIENGSEKLLDELNNIGEEIYNLERKILK